MTLFHFKYALTARSAVLSAAAFLFALPVCLGQVQLQPAPREAQFDGVAALPEMVVVRVPGGDAEDEFAARDLTDALKQEETERGHDHAAKGVYRVTLLRTDAALARLLLKRHDLTFDAPMQDEGYVMILEPYEGYIIGATSAGLFYGVQTLKQMLPAAGDKQEIPTGMVRDWPAMKYRGIEDDLSRGPFPTLAFQEHQMKLFASFKANVYCPYFENTLLYPNEPVPAPPGGSMTPSDVKELVAYAKQYHVMIVPQQEAIGHLNQALKWEVNQDVAETPYGQVLAPGQPGTLPLIKDWFTQIAAEFPSPFIHIGADEAGNLGHGLTHERVVAEGYGPVYVDFLKQIHDALAPLHKRLLFWGDIGWADPAAVAGLPKDMVAVPWSYGRTHGFDNLIEPFAKAGMETWVAPGDSNWSRVYPDANIAFPNIQGFISDGQRLGSAGALITVWDDDGEGLFNMDWYNVLFGAVAAWQPGTSPIAPYQAAYGRLFNGDTSGKIDQAEQELTAADKLLDQANTHMDSDALVWLDPWSAQGQAIDALLRPVAKQLRLDAEQVMALVVQARLAEPDLKEQDALTAMDIGARKMDLIGFKVEMTPAMTDEYAQALAKQHEKNLPKYTDDVQDELNRVHDHCTAIRDAYSVLKDESRQVWLSENRSYWLGNVMVRYDLAIQTWEKRSIRVDEADQAMHAGQQMPSAQELGMPTQ